MVMTMMTMRSQPMKNHSWKGAHTRLTSALYDGYQTPQALSCLTFLADAGSGDSMRSRRASSSKTSAEEVAGSQNYSLTALHSIQSQQPAGRCRPVGLQRTPASMLRAPEFCAPPFRSHKRNQSNLSHTNSITVCQLQSARHAACKQRGLHKIISQVSIPQLHLWEEESTKNQPRAR